MPLNAAATGRRAAALLPVVVTGVRHNSTGSGSGSGSRKTGRAAKSWHGHLLLAAAVVLWLALMDAGMRNDARMQHGPHSLRQSGSGIQLQDLGRLLLTRCLPVVMLTYIWYV